MIEKNANAGQDATDADALLQRDHLSQKDVAQKAGAHRLTQNAHGYNVCGEPFEQPVEDELAQNRGNQRQAEEAEPGARAIAGEAIATGEAIKAQEKSTAAIAQHGIGQHAQTAPHLLTNEEIDGDDRRGHERHEVANKGAPADGEIAPADNGAAGDSQKAARERSPAAALVPEQICSQNGEQGLQRHQHHRAGHRCEFERFKPEHIVHGQHEARKHAHHELLPGQAE